MEGSRYPVPSFEDATEVVDAELLHPKERPRVRVVHPVAGRARQKPNPWFWPHPCYDCKVPYEPVNPEQLRALAGRAWDQIAIHKASYWTRRRAQAGVASAFVAAEALRARMRAMHPQWPDARQRELDLAHHMRVAELLQRAHEG